MADPYQILGVDRNATDEEIKRAYRRLAKQYHPDRNPGDAEAARKMQEVNAAYEQIKNPEKAQPNPGGYGGYYDPFGTYGRQQGYGSADDPYQRSAEQYIRFGRYQEALNTLNSCADRNARWYYLSALANNGLGNQVTALEHIRRAVSMEPDNYEYQQVLDMIEHGGAAYRQQAGNFRGFSMRSDPCTNFCMCWLFNLLCCGGSFPVFCCC